MDFSLWNGTSVSHMFIRLITKTNHPHSAASLTMEEFENDYNTLKEFIEWHKTNNTNRLFNFTQENMNKLINAISFRSYNKEELYDLWSEVLMANYNFENA